MKKLTLLLVSALLCITSTFAQKSNDHKDIKMYEQVWNKILNEAQIDLINDENFDPNIIQINTSGNIVGIADFKTYYQNYLTGFSDIKFTVIDVFGQGSKIVKHWMFKGTHTGDFFGIPATGKSVALQGVTLVKMKNGKIAQEQDFFDNAAVMQQLGLNSNPNNMVIIDKLYKDFAAGDMPSVLGAMSEYIGWNEAEGNALAVGNPYIGPEAVKDGVFMKLASQYDFFKLDDLTLHEMSNNEVFATMRYMAKVKKTGKVINLQAAHRWTLDNGKITRFQQYVDTKRLAEADNE
ncbi:hypothetical protein LX77_03869 [Gelidibacter algens]|uniref:SnoaL-like domain-containing protein n=1 Tax=Gelidibacter algens TaxID=49280 RepID=A0A327RK62_9FLAO|nr:ester cyclase [Gelidibacter algens]RAJ17526.1 hypothetical protein LX77_03869 [Gelidibacter algens]